MVVVIGSYSEAALPGIHLYSLEESREKFVPASDISGIENPSYLCVSESTNTIYAIRENKENSDSQLDIYEVQKDGLQARLIDRIAFKGAGSCYICKDAENKHAFIANYGEGTLMVVRLPKNGNPGLVVQQVSFSGSGPDPERQDQPHLHTAVLSKDEQHLFCTDLGSDKLYCFEYHKEKGTPLQPGLTHFVQLPPGSGPRHLAITPDGQWLYLVTELSGEIFVFNAHQIGAGWMQRISITTEGFNGKTEGGDIQVHGEGQLLYISNRGNANEIVTFQIEPSTGKLQFLQRTGAAGLSPRNLFICEDKALLLVANEQSDNVSVFKINEDGCLEFTKKRLQIPAPTCIKMLKAI